MVWQLSYKAAGMGQLGEKEKSQLEHGNPRKLKDKQVR